MLAACTLCPCPQRSLWAQGEREKVFNLLQVIVNYVDQGGDILLAECRWVISRGTWHDFP